MRKKKKLKKIFKIIMVLIIIIIITFIKDYKENQKSIYSNSSTIINGNTNLEIDAISYLESISKKDNRIKEILDNKEKYPNVLLEMLSRNLDMIEYVSNYLNYKGKIFSNDIGATKKGTYPQLLQYDERWGYGMYGEDVIAIEGCGPTSLAIVIAGLTGKNNITPYNIAEYAFNNGYYDGGTSWLLFTTGVKHYGIIGREISLSKSVMISELNQGHPIICSVRNGDFTTTGHIIVITGIKDGKFVINDPNSIERSNMLWSYERIQYQIRNLWAFELE